VEDFSKRRVRTNPKLECTEAANKTRVSRPTFQKECTWWEGGP
jgi:predicted DNA-binding protein (UPF0251 family)